MVSIIIAVSMITVLSISAETSSIPSWIKNTAGFWADDQISDSEFISALQFLVENRILVIPPPSSNIPSPPSTVTTPIPSTNPSTVQSDISRIENFLVFGSPSEDKYTIRFSLMSPNQLQIGSDGTVDFSIVDENNRILFQNKFSVTKNQFQTYQLMLTGQKFLAYLWEIPTTDVKKGSGYFGTAKLVFTDKSGKQFKSESSVDMPKLSESELEQLKDIEYGKTAITVGNTVIQGNFKITLEKVGVYKYSSFENDVEGFRADFMIENISTETNYMPSSIVLIDDKNNQYETSYFGTLGFSEIFPKAKKQGYVIFDGFTGDASAVTIMIKEFNYPSDYIWKWNVQLIK